MPTLKRFFSSLRDFSFFSLSLLSELLNLSKSSNCNSVREVSCRKCCTMTHFMVSLRDTLPDLLQNPL